MKRSITVYIRGVAHLATYYPGLPGNRDNPPDPDEIELTTSSALCPDRHPLLYADLIRQARVAFYGVEL